MWVRRAAADGAAAADQESIMNVTDLDLHSLDEVIQAMYGSISGPPGGQDWELSRRLFHPDARLVRTRLDANGRPLALSFSIDAYQENARELLKNQPFFEIETARRTVCFGNIAQVFSAYEARPAPGARELIKRGMNMIHLYDDGARWWIMHMIWDDEREGVSVPSDLFKT
jgi:hypothetical protein